LPYVSLPIYLHRRFRHGFLFVNANKGFKLPKDLAGKRIGGTNYSPASNIWMRGILEQYWELPHRSIVWVTERDEAVQRTCDLRIDLQRSVVVRDGSVVIALARYAMPRLW